MASSRSWSPSSLLASVSRLEVVVAGAVVVVLVALAIAEPDILEAPFENERTLLFTVGGTLIAIGVLAVMLHYGVPPAVRVLVVGVPFVAVTWWLISPFFIDEHVDDEFAVSIADATTSSTAPSSSTAPPSTTTTSSGVPSTVDPPETTTTAPPAPTGPVLRGSGSIVGLAGHRGSGQVGVFDLEDGSSVLRLEGIDIQNGPDLHLYVVPGNGATDPIDGSIYLGGLRGNVGDLTYDLPGPLPAGPWTVLVWCDAFSVEFVGADVSLT